MSILAPFSAALRRAIDLATAAPPLPPAADTAGGDDHLADESPTWDGGRYLGAQWSPIHPGRVGRAIRPWCVVLHTTDMAPPTFGALLRRSTADAERGDLAAAAVLRWGSDLWRCAAIAPAAP